MAVDSGQSSNGQQPMHGSTIETVYSRRKMKCYSVTESELKQIGLANLGATICVGIGSALFAFGVDVFKDSILATEIPKEANILIDSIQPICLYLGAAFYIAAAALLWWRQSMIGTIKSESDEG
ncbi:hypothetical protein [Sphingopyxis sp.]|uniref:hypothetical protein n=1 Tax=Sphingopyxis sp. TaxID=1908224 RepID=UPI003D0B88D0